MSRRRAGILACMLLAAGGSVALACAVAPPANKSVAIADESAIIVWNAETKTEHFIRRASFRTEADDFGFLVPTPSQPELGEVDNAAFAQLARITAPKVVTRPQPGIGIGCAAKSVTFQTAGNVQVLEEKRVAGYDAVVLEATDAAALLSWLRTRGYDFSDSLRAWTSFYLNAKWKITAFKIAKDDKGQPVTSTSAVRMTFKTDKPFYPYKEPINQFAAEKISGPRLLRVFFIGSERVQGMLDGQAWPGKPAWSNTIEHGDRAALIEKLKLPANTSPTTWRLTEFEDHSSPRPANADVYFQRDPDQGILKREPNVRYVSNSARPRDFGLALLACAVGVLIVRRRAA